MRVRTVQQLAEQDLSKMRIELIGLLLTKLDICTCDNCTQRYNKFVKNLDNFHPESNVVDTITVHELITSYFDLDFDGDLYASVFYLDDVQIGYGKGFSIQQSICNAAIQYLSRLEKREE